MSWGTWRWLGAVLAAAIVGLAESAAAQQQMTVGELAQQVVASAPKVTTGAAEKSDEAPRLIAPLVWGQDDEWQLRFGGYSRLRMEARIDPDMERDTDDDDEIGFLRSHLNAELLYRDLWRVFLEVSDARAFSQEVDYLQTDRVDLHQAYLEARLGGSGSPWLLRLGRQEMSLGEKRLVDSARWSNLANTWDGARLMHKTDKAEWSGFVMVPDTYSRQQSEIVTTARRQQVDGQLFYGIYGAMKPGKGRELDLYFLGLNDDGNRVFPSPPSDEEGDIGSSDRYTIGTRLRGPLWEREECGELGYGLEAAYQFGRTADDSLRAAMLHADLVYKWHTKWKPTMTLEGNLATGDEEKGDGQNNTFSPLFGTTHSPYGIIDYTRLQNLREIALKGTIEPTDKLKLEAGAHAFWLDSDTDTWYRPVGNIGPDATGSSGRDLGQELDIVATYKVSKWSTLEMGAAQFFGGGYPAAQGRDDDGKFAYVQWSLRF